MRKFDTTKCPRCDKPHEGLKQPPLLGFVCQACMTHHADREQSQQARQRVGHGLQRLARISDGLYPSDLTHPTFRALREVIAIHRAAQTGVRRGWCLVGPSGLTKTRNALNLLAEAVTQEGKTVDIFWGRWMQEEAQRDAAKWSRPDVLLLDDAFQHSGRGEQSIFFLRDLLDLRRGKETIITSQIGGQQWLEHLAKSQFFSVATAANVEAIRRRIGEQ